MLPKQLPMILHVKKSIIEKVTTDITFPILRLHTESDMRHEVRTFWKFESKNKVTKIVERWNETSIMTFEDYNADFVKDLLPYDMLFPQPGMSNYEEITEKAFDLCLQRLIDIIHRS